MLKAQDTAHDHLRQVIAANSLAGPGKSPFHLQMTFQYYDLQGKPGDAGVLDEWWATPDSYLITVSLPSHNQGKPAPLDDTLEIDPREDYALRIFLGAETDPVPANYADAGNTIREFNKRVGKNELTCFGPEVNTTEVCIDSQGDGIRLLTRARTVVAMRNTLGDFDQTKIATDVAIAYGGIPAIGGQLRTIEVFDPSHSNIELQQISSDSVRSFSSLGVVPGKLVKRVNPDYSADIPFSKGSVLPDTGTLSILVACRIKKDGTTYRVFALNSPDPKCTQSALDAVKRFKFQPFLFKGKPVEVSFEVEFDLKYRLY